MATVLVQEGTLKKGCVLVSGMGWGKIRTLTNESGHMIDEATPSAPVLTSGWRVLPEAGRKCFQVPTSSPLLVHVYS